MPVEDAVLSVSRRIAKWASSREEFGSLRVDGMLHHWEASLHCVFWKNNISVSWSPPFSKLKFNDDGVTKGKLGPAGREGGSPMVTVFFLVLFSKHLGSMEPT